MNEKRYNEIMKIGDVALNELVTDDELDAVNIRYDQEYTASAKHYLDSKREVRKLMKAGIITREVATIAKNTLHSIYYLNY